MAWYGEQSGFRSTDRTTLGTVNTNTDKVESDAVGAWTEAALAQSDALGAWAQAVTNSDSIQSISDAVQTINTYTKPLYEKCVSAQYIYPDLAAGTTVTSSDVAWSLGDFATIIPLNTISSDYHIHHVNASMSADGEYQLNLYVSDASVISDYLGSCVFHRETNKTYAKGIPISSAHNSANDAVRVRLATENAAGDTANIKLSYHKHT